MAILDALRSSNDDFREKIDEEHADRWIWLVKTKPQNGPPYIPHTRIGHT